ncbi:galactose-binding domain-containing protein [Burkholderia plantarii]|uniref:galactose-binding domain-containing protein n=1 Tax=Burkholderia plantarii TaxID=41899 RepID=UPI00114D2070|nr:calcium-binding protein [Burkholderia plantarii]
MNYAQLEQLRGMISAGDLAGFYGYMANLGYNYAYLAGGLVTGGGFSGAAAINYMLSVAHKDGVAFSEAQIPDLEKNMAFGWLDALEQVATKNGVVDADLGYEDTLNFHVAVFKQFGLGKEAWTLTTPGEILGIPYMEGNFASLLVELGANAGADPIVSEGKLVAAMQGAGADGQDFSLEDMVAANAWLATNALNVGSDFVTIIKNLGNGPQGTLLPDGSIEYDDSAGYSLIQHKFLVTDINGTPQTTETENVWVFPIPFSDVSIESNDSGVVINQGSGSKASVLTSGAISVSGTSINVSADSAGAARKVEIVGDGNEISALSPNASVGLVGDNNSLKVGGTSVTLTSTAGHAIDVTANRSGQITIDSGTNVSGLSAALNFNDDSNGSLLIGGQPILNFGASSSIKLNDGSIVVSSTDPQSGANGTFSFGSNGASFSEQNADGSISASWSGQSLGSLTLSSWTQNGVTYSSGDVISSAIASINTNAAQQAATGETAVSAAYGNDLGLIATNNTSGLASDVAVLVGLDGALTDDVSALSYLSERIANGYVSDKYVADFIGPAPGSTFSLDSVLALNTFDAGLAAVLSHIAISAELRNTSTRNWSISVQVEGFGNADPDPDSKSKSGFNFNVPTQTGSDPQLSYPLVLDLDGKGINLVQASQSNATFDINDTGTRQQVGWVGATNGILVFDQNHNGTIDNASEWFGQKFSVDGTPPASSQTGFQALATLAVACATSFSETTSLVDPTTGKTYFDEVQVWVDSNQNGVTDAGELHSLSDLGITSISLQPTQVDQYVGTNSVASTASYTLADGTRRTIDDIGLATTSAGTSGGSVAMSAAGALSVAAFVSKGYAATGAGQASAIASGLQGVSVGFSGQIAAIQRWYNTNRIMGAGNGSTIGPTAGVPAEISAYGASAVAGAVPWSGGGYVTHSTAPADTVNVLNGITALAPVAVSTANAVAYGASTIMSAQVAAEHADITGTASDVSAAQAAAQSANTAWGTAIADYLNASGQVDVMSQELSNVTSELTALVPVNYEATGNLANGYSYFSSGDAQFASDTFAGFVAGQSSFAALKDGLDRTLSAIAQTGDFEQIFVGKANATTTLGAGQDAFLAAGGSETIVDGAGQDTILLNPDSGNLTVWGFKTGMNGDQLQFLDVGSSITLSSDGSTGTYIRYGNNQSVDLVGVDASSLDLFNNITGVGTVSYAGVAQAGTRNTAGTRVYDGQVHVTGVIASNAGDTLSGDTAATTLTGGAGNDTFKVEGNGYVINGAGGTNTVSYGDVPFGVSVNLQTGTDNLGTTLFAIQNVEGSSYDDTIAGDTNNNVLDGKGGNDTLIGGGGNDTYVFDAGYGSVTIENGLAPNGIPSSELLFGAGIDANDLWFTRSGNDLTIQMLGTDNQVTVKGWFSNAWQQLASISLSDGLQVSPQTVATILKLQALYVAANPGFDPDTAQAMPGGIDLTSYFGPVSNPTTVPTATNVALATEHLYTSGVATQGANLAGSAATQINNPVGSAWSANVYANNLAYGSKALPAPYGSGENYAYQYYVTGSSQPYVALSVRPWGQYAPGTSISTTPPGVTSYQQIYALTPSTFYVKATTSVSPSSSSNPDSSLVFASDPNVMVNAINAVTEAVDLATTGATLAQAISTADTARQTALGSAVAANSAGAAFGSQPAVQARADATTAEADLAAALAQWAPVQSNLVTAGGVLASSQAALNGILPGTQVSTQQRTGYGLSGPSTVTVTYTTNYSFYTSTDQAEFNALQSAVSNAQGAVGEADFLMLSTLQSALQDFGAYERVQVGGTSSNLGADDGGDLLIAAGGGYHTVVGGAGRDTFVFGGWNDTSSATVQNFATGTQGDRLLLIPAQNRTVYLTDGGGTTDASFFVDNGGVDTVALAGVSLGALSLYDNFNGVDTASFANESHGVSIDLATVTPRSYDGSTHIRNLVGSNYGDTLTGDEQDNVITGGAGNDVLSGGAGNNTLDGGGGNNTVSYAGSPGGVTVDLTAGTASNGYGGTDTLSHIQNVIGSGGNDTMFGDANNNVLDGNGGNDVLVGGGGSDTYVFDAGYGQDVIVNGVAGNAGPSGQLTLGAGLSAANLRFVQSGNDLVIEVLGTTEQVTVQDWFQAGASYRQLATIALADGTTLSMTDVNGLVAEGHDWTPLSTPSASTSPTLAGRYVYIRKNDGASTGLVTSEIQVWGTDGSDLALGTAVTSSPSWGDGTTAVNAVNGSTSASGGIFASASADGWVEVDLGSVQTIAGVDVWGRDDGSEEMNGNYTVYVSNQDMGGLDAGQLQAVPGARAYQENQPGPMDVKVTSWQAPSTVTQTTGRYVYVRKNDGASTGLVTSEIQVWGAGGVDLALGKTVTSSSSWSSDTTAANAINGVTSASGGLFASASLDGWIEIDLGSVQAIDGIDVWGRDDGAFEMNGDYTVYVSNQDLAGLDASQIQASVPNVQRFQQNDRGPNDVAVSSWQAPTALAATAGRYVYVRKNDGASTGLVTSEIQVWGADGSDLALGKTVTSSTSWGDSTMAANAVNGSTGASGGIFASASADGWIEVDLGSVQTINGIDVWGRDDGALDMNGNYTVYVSNQDLAGLSAAQAQATAGVKQFQQSQQGALDTAVTSWQTPATAATTLGRYVYVRKNDGASTGLVTSEIQVWGTDGSDLALGKTVTSSKSWGDSTTAANAINGVTSASGGIFASASADGWVEIDLGSAQTIAGIDVWGRDDGALDMNGNYTVFVSNQDMAGLDANQIQSISGAKAFQQNQQGPLDVSVTSWQSAAGSMVQAMAAFSSSSAGATNTTFVPQTQQSSMLAASMQ